MKKWKFYINEVELQLDIFNFDALKYVIGRDTEYWGYFREASIDKLVFLKQDAKTIKDFFESEGVNSEKNFTIKKLNTKMSCYEDFQTGVIDFYNYKEIYNNNNKLLKVEVDLVGNSEQQKIKTRQDLDLKIGRNTSVENQSVSTISAINVKYKTRPLKLEAFTGIAAAYIGVDISLGQLNPRDLTIPTQETNNNIEFYQNSALGESGIDQVTNLLFQEMALREHLESQDTNLELDYNIDFEYTSLTSSPVVNGLKLKLQSYTYDGVNFTFVSSSILDQVDENPTPGSSQNSVNFTGTVLFDKNENLLYRLVVELSAQLFTIKFSQSIINYSYNELSFDSNHSSFLIYEVFQNLIEQITDKKDVFQSNLFGRVDLGYAAEGIASGIAVTNGLFLRNAELSDGEVVSLELNFQDLYKTLDSIYGLSLWFDGEKINIEKRTDVFGTNEIEIEPQEITRELFTKLLYTNVKVGNKQIKYENTNGTNEYNTVLQFSSPLRIKANNLDLVTKYNTDYLGVELAKRLSFASDANVDTKYDDKVFLCTVLEVEGVYETILGLSGGFTLVEGVILPTYAGNLDFSPKRMLLNNSDLINSAFWKNETDSLRFEKSQNLAALVTQKTGETSTLVELDDVAYSEMTEAKFIPMLWNFKVSENDLWKVMNNQLDIFKFALGCETKYGYLWKAEIQNDLGAITLIEKRTLSTPAPPPSLLPYLTAYWTADNIATDVYTNNLGGSFFGATYSTGINNNAFNFGSGNQTRYVNVANNSLLSFTDGTNDVPFTINMWTYYNSFNTGTGNWLFNKRQLGSRNEHQLIYSTSLGVVTFQKFSQGLSSDTVTTESNVAPTLNTWEMWTISSDGTKFGDKIYRNGVDVTASSTELGTYVKMDNTLAIVRMGNAGWSGSSSLKHKGLIDEVSLFKGTELTPTQITDLYNGGVGKFYPNI